MDIVERLRRLPGDYRIALYSEGEKDCMEAADEIERLREDRKRLREALHPFAEMADKWEDLPRDTLIHEYPSAQLQVFAHYRELSDFRKARAALKEGE